MLRAGHLQQSAGWFLAKAGVLRAQPSDSPLPFPLHPAPPWEARHLLSGHRSSLNPGLPPVTPEHRASSDILLIISSARMYVSVGGSSAVLGSVDSWLWACSVCQFPWCKCSHQD